MILFELDELFWEIIRWYVEKNLEENYNENLFFIFLFE